MICSFSDGNGGREIMIKPNWDIFKAKFNENPQSNFEWFCYLLFCREFNRERGIFRYKNQSAIETNPINVNGSVIAWQAKFYETSISNHQTDLKDTLRKLKRDYPDVNKLYIYSNQAWGQNRGKTSDVKIKIEQLAKQENICLEWKLASFFESEFVVIKNEVIAKHFFSFDKSMFSILEEMQQHSENLLEHIDSSIHFNNNIFSINREKELGQLVDYSNQICIVSGAGGVGKTVLIKNMYENLKEEDVCYIFKAIEFELRNINDIFDNYNLTDFLNIHRNIKHKIIVIDSAEKLLDLKNTDPFNEFLTEIVKNNWKVIFTTRDVYLKDLNYQFFEIYHITPLNIGIRVLEKDELITISQKQSFTLPKDEKLIELIKNPFYLNEYLKFYKEAGFIDYTEFKSTLWNKTIKKGKPERELCFLEIACQRANTGQFFINVRNGLSNYCDELMKDGMLGYEEAGYFITHDIYEEWALDKNINKAFINMSNEHDFFISIGDSLPMRRCLRSWISEKLLLEDVEIVRFIENIINNNEIENFWKDTIFSAVLLSDYSEKFFNVFKNQILSNECSILKRLIFILRIACKETDYDFFKKLGINISSYQYVQYVLTKPKGAGWGYLIEFIYNNIEKIEDKNISFIVPLISDWSDKFKNGNTTKYAGLIALNFYKKITQSGSYSSKNIITILLKTIINSAYGLQTELKEIITEILNHKWKNYQDPYYDLVKFILTEIYSRTICEVLPNEILALADLFWTYTPNKNHLFYGGINGNLNAFGISSNPCDYFPASAYQTPIYFLLQIKLKETVDFIVNFTNKSIKTYVSSTPDSRLDNISEVEVIINNKNQKQYISNSLWQIYRGTGSPVSPYLLQSIHMALEKFFLQIAKNMEAKTLVNWLNYLLESSDSASISAVVTSVVLAYPEKTFDTAKILFKTREFIIHDTIRLRSEEHAKVIYSIEQCGISKNKIYDDERIKNCEDKHRKLCLEWLFLDYQVGLVKKSEKNEVEKRQKILWKILDDYYNKLPLDSEQSEYDKIWKLFLARMDYRKMKVNTQETKQGVLVQFEPEVDSGTNEFRKQKEKKIQEDMQYQPLNLWADYKFNHNKMSEKYKEFEDNPQKALYLTKELLQKLDEFRNLDFNQVKYVEDMVLFNYSIPPRVCAVLVEYYRSQLNDAEINFCKDVILDRVKSCLQGNYSYQLGDGVQEAITLLPKLMKLFVDKKNIKLYLLFILFKDEHVGGIFLNEKFSCFSMMAICQLWGENYDDAYSLLLGYMLFQPKYIDLINKVRKENLENGNYTLDSEKLLGEFKTVNKTDLNRMVNNELSISDLGDIQNLDLFILSNAINLMPNKLQSKEHSFIAYKIISAFVRKLAYDNNDDKIDYMVCNNFLRKYAHIVLCSENSEVSKLIEPFIDNFNVSRSTAKMFQEFIYAEDQLHSYDNFWLVWNQFKDKIIKVINNKSNIWYADEIIKSYLFANVQWKDTTKEWHSLKSTNMRLIKDISEQINPHSSVLYSISKLLNDIGSPFVADGLIYISNMLSDHPEYDIFELEINTDYYLENIVRKYIYKEREQIKKNRQLKSKILVILNFLVEKGSTIGYLLRESIL